MIKRIDADGVETDSTLMAYFGDCKAHSVGTDRVKAYMSQRLELGAANATINRELASLKRAFNLGIAIGKDSSQALYSDAEREQRERAFLSMASL